MIKVIVEVLKQTFLDQCVHFRFDSEVKLLTSVHKHKPCMLAYIWHPCMLLVQREIMENNRLISLIKIKRQIHLNDKSKIIQGQVKLAC